MVRVAQRHRTEAVAAGQRDRPVHRGPGVEVARAAPPVPPLDGYATRDPLRAGIDVHQPGGDRPGEGGEALDAVGVDPVARRLDEQARAQVTSFAGDPQPLDGVADDSGDLLEGQTQLVGGTRHGPLRLGSGRAPRVLRRPATAGNGRGCQDAPSSLLARHIRRQFASGTFRYPGRNVPPRTRWIYGRAHF